MLNIMVKNVDKEQIIRLNGDFVPINLQDWNVDIDLIVNVGV